MDGIIDQVRRMPLAEKRRLAEALRQAIAEELASGGGEPDRCPRCGPGRPDAQRCPGPGGERLIRIIAGVVLRKVHAQFPPHCQLLHKGVPVLAGFIP